MNESGRPIRNNANRPQTYGTGRNLNKQNGVFAFSRAASRGWRSGEERKQKKKKTRALCRSLENQRIITPSVNTRVQNPAVCTRRRSDYEPRTSFQLTRTVPRKYIENFRVFRALIM